VDPFSGMPSTESSSGFGLPRRALLQGAVATGLAAGSVPMSAAVAGGKPKAPVTDWSAFDRLVQAAFLRFKLVGAAVAVVSADQVLHTATFGYRSLQPRRRVTPTTRFRVGSTSKSMTAALIATYVDEKKFGWDQPVIDVWPNFRAPTDQLTKTLKVRDLLGMDSGLGEPPATSELHLGDWTPLQLVQGIVNLPVLGPPGTTFFYNNSVNAVGGYLPFLADGVKPSDLLAAYSNAMRERILRPAGMSGATVADDPRGVVDDYAVGCGLDLRVKAYEMPFGPLGGATPAGGTSAHVGDMAVWVQLQLRQGLSVTGTRVVSAANLAECWKGHIAMEFSTAYDPDAVGVQYGMGWINETYKGNIHGVLPSARPRDGRAHEHEHRASAQCTLRVRAEPPTGAMVRTQPGHGREVPDHDRQPARRLRGVRSAGQTPGQEGRRSVARLLRRRLLLGVARQRSTAEEGTASGSGHGPSRRRLRPRDRVQHPDESPARAPAGRSSADRDRRAGDRASIDRLRLDPVLSRQEGTG
jgi:CubicO group peptidase (beta-lactamase class C family)